jgi:hypothetical protein
MKALLVAVTLIVSVTCQASTGEDEDGPANYVSLVNLIASPERYVGHNVSATGYLSATSDYLFLTRDHAELGDSATGVKLSILFRESDVSEHGVAATGCESRFVRVWGRFEGKDLLDFGIYNVSTIVALGKLGDRDVPQVCWSNRNSSPADSPAN